MATITFPVHAINTEAGPVDTAAIKTMLAGATAVYSSIDIAFELVSSEVVIDQALVDDAGPRGIEPVQFHLARQSRAIRHPGRIVVFFRPADNSQSSNWADYIVMSGTDSLSFAHEVGHFLHLTHTFNDDITNALAANISSAGGYASAVASAVN